MIARIIALAALLSLASGGAWYIFRDTPQKRIQQWREQARYYLDEEQDLKKAEEFTNMILSAAPPAARDLILKAQVRERHGTPQGYRDALEIYEKILSSGDNSTLGAAFMKARACRFLGLLQQAQGSLLSVVDMFPFDATMELGENAIMSLAGWEALQHFTKAKDIATETREEARASEGVANAYFLNLSLLKARVASAQQNHEAEKEKAALALIQKYSSDCKRILKGALELLKTKESPKTPAEADLLLVWGATITEKLARLSEPGEKPYTDGMLLVDGRRSDYGLIGQESPKLLVRLGLLKLLVVQNEPQALPGRVDSLGKEAEEHF
ncbi:MAG TPA: hypothetical protein VFD71_19845, partial [Planctomycetota bacterium]|nr:hypothetical protein [Planctomycetota bacterium]